VFKWLTLVQSMSIYNMKNVLSMGTLSIWFLGKNMI